MRLFPLGSFGSPPSEYPELRGVALYWIAPGPATSLAWKKFTPLIPEPIWHHDMVPFTALTLDHADRPPATTVESEHMVRHAAAITIVQHVVPSGVPVYYEVGAWVEP